MPDYSVLLLFIIMTVRRLCLPITRPPVRNAYVLLMLIESACCCDVRPSVKAHKPCLLSECDTARAAAPRRLDGAGRRRARCSRARPRPAWLTQRGLTALGACLSCHVRTARVTQPLSDRTADRVTYDSITNICSRRCGRLRAWTTCWCGRVTCDYCTLLQSERSPS